MPLALVPFDEADALLPLLCTEVGVSLPDVGGLLLFCCLMSVGPLPFSACSLALCHSFMVIGRFGPPPEVVVLLVLLLLPSRRLPLGVERPLPLERPPPALLLVLLRREAASPLPPLPLPLA